MTEYAAFDGSRSCYNSNECGNIFCYVKEDLELGMSYCSDNQIVRISRNRNQWFVSNGEYNRRG